MAKMARGTILYGMMGAGKTTLGRGLARHLGQELTDTDALMFLKFGTTASDIVADSKRDFADCQAEAILAHSPTQPEVIATGGSVAMYPELVGHLANFGVGIFIDVDPEALDGRLPASRKGALNNPRGLNFQDLCRQRAPLYREATDLVLHVAGGEKMTVSLANLIDLRASVAE